jgi:hypothetical protein
VVVFLAAVCISAQGGLQVDKSSIGGTVVNAGGLDGRIDNPNAGWKGRGIWTSFNSYLPKFSETKLGYLNHIQYRPNLLAN